MSKERNNGTKSNVPKTKKNDKFRNYQFEIYEESAPVNWHEILKELAEKHDFTFIVSPPHNADLKDDGTIKKTHYHIIVSCVNPRSFANVKKVVLAPFLNNGTNDYMEVCEYYDRCVRYICHLDNEDKTTYNIADVKYIGGKSMALIVDRAKNILEKNIVDVSLADEVMKQISNAIVDKNITEYIDLWAHLEGDGLDVQKVMWNGSKSTHLYRLIQSNRNKQKEGLISNAGIAFAKAKEEEMKETIKAQQITITNLQAQINILTDKIVMISRSLERFDELY